MFINQQDTQNSLIRLYFPLDALHVSDYISPSSGAIFTRISCTSHLVYARRVVLAYTKCDVQLIRAKISPDDGLTESETCRASNGK